MTKTEHFNLIWQTYEFTLAKLVNLEDDYQYLFAQINHQLDEDKKIKADLKVAFIENARDLALIYNKQLKTIKELVDFCDANNAWRDNEIIPEEYQMSKGSLLELAQTTQHLEEVLKDSMESVESLLDY
tara:strand:- start:19412 stop:19798 length:387 start_codon:yes stop_codon:yes gene_type:complete